MSPLVCSKCKKEKRRKEMRTDKSNHRGYSSWCKECTNNRLKQWRLKNPHKEKAARWDYTLKTVHGITSIQYRNMLKAQGKRCAICGSKKSIQYGKYKRFDVDHDHKTGKIRGLLCSFCNLALGLLRDSPAFLNNAARYLRKANA